MLKSARILLLLTAPVWPAAAQAFDNTGNNLLNGTYYFREVIYSLSSNLVAVAYGTITFSSSTGTYTVSASELDSNSNVVQSLSNNGTYSISASGYGTVDNQLLGSPVFGLVSNGVFIGSSTESGFNDLFIAAPIAGQNTGTLQGPYSIAYIHPLVPFDGLLRMSPNGAGAIGTVNVSAYQTNSTPFNQSISGVKYFVSNNAFVLTYPNSQNNVITGTQYLYSSSDGSFIFGGSPQDYDMFIGVRNGSPGANFGGIYYQAGLNEDVSQLAAGGGVGLSTYYGSFSANNGVILGHQRIQINSLATGYTYSDAYTQNTDGTYNDAAFAQNYIGAGGGTVRIGYGLGPSLGISVALQAPSFSGDGVYLSPVGVTNSASSSPFTAGVSRGELVALTGTNLGPSVPQMAPAPPYFNSLGNVQVLFNNVAAPLASVSSNLILAIVPYETTAAVAQIQVINNGAMSNVVTEFVNATTPGVFTNPAGGTGNAVAMHGDGSAVTPDSPAAIGETITVLVAGLGDVLPAIADGSAGTSGSATFNTIFAGVGSVPATNVSAGLAPNLVGYYQVMLTIPSGVTAGNNFLYIGGPDSISSEAIISIAGP